MMDLIILQEHVTPNLTRDDAMAKIKQLTNEFTVAYQILDDGVTVEKQVLVGPSYFDVFTRKGGSMTEVQAGIIRAYASNDARLQSDFWKTIGRICKEDGLDHDEKVEIVESFVRLFSWIAAHGLDTITVKE